jgi:hypothetical protein
VTKSVLVAVGGGPEFGGAGVGVGAATGSAEPPPPPQAAITAAKAQMPAKRVTFLVLFGLKVNAPVFYMLWLGRLFIALHACENVIITRSVG